MRSTDDSNQDCRKSLIAEVKALYAEQWGFMSRQADDDRETNPYARLDLKVPSNIEKVNRSQKPGGVDGIEPRQMPRNNDVDPEVTIWTETHVPGDLLVRNWSDPGSILLFRRLRSNP